MEPLDDLDAVLHGLQFGNAEAAERLYVVLGRRVAAYLRARGVEDPDSLTNEVFARVFRNLAGFDGGAVQLRAWVFAIARNLALDEHRHRTRRPDARPMATLPDDAAGGVSPDATADGVWGPRSAPAAEQEALDRRGTAWVLEVLDDLTPDQRDVLALRVVADLTVEQVAEVLGKPAGAVKALQRRAISTLRRTFSGEAVPL